MSATESEAQARRRGTAAASRARVWVAALSIVFLAALGALSARAGGAQVLPAAWRVTLWGALAMGVTALAGTLFAGVA